MSPERYLLYFFVCWLFFAIVLGFLAGRKNRNTIGWALIGGLFPLPALIILAFLRPLCPKCRNQLSVKQWKEGKCPNCEKKEAGRAPTGVGSTEPPDHPKKKGNLRWICAFIGICLGLWGGIHNLPELGATSLFGPAIFFGVIGFCLGYMIQAIIYAVSKEKEYGQIRNWRFKICVGVLVIVAIVIGIFALIRLDVTGKKGSGLGKEYFYDVKDLAKIDPDLILYEESARSLSTGFTDSHGIALDSQGSIYVAGDRAIRVFAQSGDLLDEIELADVPRCLTVAGDSRIYVGMKNHVEVYNDDGKRLTSWDSLGERAVLTSIAVSKNDVFVADAGNRIVLHYDTTGTLINRIGGKDKARNIPGFVIPSPYFDLVVARDGLLRVVNPGLHHIEAYTFDGDLEFWWGEFSSAVEGFCGCCNPVNFAILKGPHFAGADDSFVTCEKGLIRVKIYDAEGAFVGVVAGPEQLVEGGASRVSEFGVGSQTGGFDVAVDAQGRIFVLDTINNVVRVFIKKKAE